MIFLPHSHRPCSSIIPTMIYTPSKSESLESYASPDSTNTQSSWNIPLNSGSGLPKHIWHEWFIEWPIERGATQTAKEYKQMRADQEQRKIEIFTLYIMGLKNRWVENGPPPENWTLAGVFTKLDELEDMITRQFKEVEHYFVEVEERWNLEDLHI
ncbi:uncharacterized protein EV420DRAFT_1769871 [Desarmillaria tabescens]|uniref:Uncharacterized protein n=1 Tax=Armillaria tabescens TaxID=1929756 RepID=A0AA39JAD6_ARMTA|nr:uncharacterized protein EV420DRAFT_1769871 [Desarmillaria tabescens]KAK0437739.1 hypothetical protein EV420DRAFT_1769871 [Desarmillaria tabescens]